MNKELRDYQRECIESVIADWQTHRSVVASLPTGTGKTFTALSLLEKYGKPFLFVVPRDFLVEQTVHQAQEMCIPAYGISGKGKIGDSVAPNVIATVQWLNARKGKNLIELLEGKQIKVVILDECHHAIAQSYKFTQETVLNSTDDARCLGLTATLQRADKKPLKLAFNKLSFWLPISYFINRKYLSQIESYLVETNIDVRKVKMDSHGEDFIEKQLVDAVKSTNWKEKAIEKWREVAEGKKTIVFCASVELSKDFVESAKSQGISCEHVDGTTDNADRASIVKRFSSGEVTILSNYGVFTEGFDIPDTECVIMARPTKSQGLYIQCIGRGLRVAPGKEKAIILDLTDSYHTLIQYADIDPPRRIKKLHESVLSDVFTDQFGDQFSIGLVGDYDNSRESAVGTFETGEETIKRLVDLCESGVSWLVLGERAVVNAFNVILILPMTEYAKHVLKDDSKKEEDDGMYCAVLIERKPEGGFTEGHKLIGCSTRLGILDLAIDSAVITAQWQTQGAKWRRQTVSENQADRLKGLGFKGETIASLTRGDASNLLTYIYSCQKLGLPLGDSVSEKQDLPPKPETDGWRGRIYALEKAIREKRITPTAWERNFIDSLYKMLVSNTLNDDRFSVKQDATLNKIFDKYFK